MTLCTDYIKTTEVLYFLIIFFPVFLFYFKGSLVKVEVGLVKGKKLYDKRDDIAKKDMKREAERDFKIRNI